MVCDRGSAETTSDALVAIRQVGLSYPHATWKLEIRDLTIKSGIIYSLLGKNMVGKTTLLRLLAGVMPQVIVGSISGTAWTQTEPSAIALSSERMNGRCLISHDDPMFPELSIWDNVRISRPTNASVTDLEVNQRLSTFLIGIPAFTDVKLSTPVGQLSSGGRALVRLARVLAWQPLLVLVDEVTSQLDDANSHTFIEQLLRSLRPDAAVVFVSHAQRDHINCKKIANSTGFIFRQISITLRGEVATASEVTLD